MKLQQILPAFTGELGGLTQPLVNARDLHVSLGVGRDFTNWIKDRIETYGFIEGEDFSPNLAKTSFLGRPRTEYHLSIDMAKELAMIENNEVGRQIRRQLIAFEREVPSVIRRLENQLAAAQWGALAHFPLWKMAIRYYEMGLSQGEVCKLLDLSDTSVRKHYKRLAEMGLIDWRVDPHRSKLGKKAAERFLITQKEAV